MLTMIESYVSESLVQKKGKNLKWIDIFGLGITGILTGVREVGKFVRLMKHLLTASRKGDESVRYLHILNMLLVAGLTGIGLLFWCFFKNSFFTSFSPFSYWDLNGSFWTDIWKIVLPACAYAFFLGQLDWFGSNDPYEEGTVVSESLQFKILVSFAAGLSEELGHRAAFIYCGLVIVYLSNLFFGWLVAFFILCIAIYIIAVLEFDIIYAVLIGILTALSLYFLWNKLENIVLILNGIIFDFLAWISSGMAILFPSIFILMLICTVVTTEIRKEQKGYTISAPELIVWVTMFAIFSCYALPLGVKAMASAPLIPAKADKWTYLLYIGAMLWSNAKFRNFHKYQGPAGMLNSYIIGFYMFYIAFTHGLIYAIAVHFLFDATLFSSEHLVQVIKDWDKQ